MEIPQGPFHLPMLRHFHERVVGGESQCDTLRVMSWNILAERLVSASQYPYVSPQYLDYCHRIDIIVHAMTYTETFDNGDAV
jgi:mRNA deadenylase 3'-5' endonuclease subunit Ccr4